MDTTTTIQTLTAGLRALPTDDVARVRHFLAEYLGDTQHQVPFGGRAKDFTHLDNWLDEREGPPYALLAAPAGRGKSALLARWCQRLLTRADLAVVYFPVSIRFRTNLAGVVFPALVALLAGLHAEDIPHDPHTSAETWRGLLHDYLTRPLADGRRLLLVLDGVDEAAGWQAGPWLLPTEPPPGLRVVLSARYLANDRDAGAWLTRLGWTRPGLATTFDLYPLDRTGIASVLVQMGFPLDLLGARVDMVAELHRLSEGDPLLVRLYVDDLWTRGPVVTRLTPADLATIRPGLGGYFERWWNEQRSLWEGDARRREETLQNVLNLLAGALGPLSRRDILNLSPDDPTLHDDRLEDLLAPLARFVIGDGLHQGYVFSHPRLAGYFLEERLDEGQRRAVEQRFLDWGARTLDALNAGGLLPEQASPYIVQYYGVHLERAQAEAGALFALVSDGWRRAWEKLDRAHAGFLGDSERARRAAVHANALAAAEGHAVPYLPEEIRSLLCRASINSITGNVSSRLMREAVKTGVWSPAQGLASIRLLPDPVPRARELVGLAPLVPEPLRTTIQQEALDILANLKDPREYLDALVELAPAFSGEMLAQILDLVLSIEDEADRAGMFADLAPALAQSPALSAKALDLAQEIEGEEYFVDALEGLLPSLPTEQRSHALRLARSIEDDRARARALTALIPSLSPDEQAEILAESRSLSASISQIRLLARLVGVVAEPIRDETLREILELLNEVIDQDYRVEILLILAPFLSEEKVRWILREVCELGDESSRAQALRELFPHLPKTLLPPYLDAVLALHSDEQRTAVLLPLLPALPSLLQITILEHVPEIWDEGLRVEILAKLAPLLDAASVPRLVELVAAVRDAGYRTWLLAELEIALPGRRPGPTVVQTFEQMFSTTERLQTLLAIVERLSAPARARIFAIMEHEIFGFHESLRFADQQADIFARLAPYMPETWLPRVLQWTGALRNDVYRVQVLTALAARLNDRLLPRALDIVRDMKERAWRGKVLEALVSALPEEHKGERVREMLQILQVIKDEQERIALFTAFLGVLEKPFPFARLPLVLAATASLRSPSQQARILAALIPHIPIEHQVGIFHMLPTIRDEEARAQVLTALVPYLSEHTTSRFFALMQGIREQHTRTPLLMALVEHVTPVTFPPVLVLVQDVPYQNARAELLTRLVRSAPVSAFPALWQAFQQLSTQGERAVLLRVLAERMPEDYFAVFWRALLDIGHQGWQLRVISTLAAQLPEQNFPLLWTAIRAVADLQWQALAIKALAEYLPASLYPQVFQVALHLPFKQFHLSEAAPEAVLGTLADFVPENFFLSFWQAVEEMASPREQIHLRARLAARVPASSFAEIWHFVSITDEQRWIQVHSWETLLARTPESAFARVWETVSALEDPWRRGRFLLVLAERVPAQFLPSFWQAVKATKDPEQQAALLKKILPRLPREMLAEAVEMALVNREQEERLALLEMLLAQFSEEQSETFLLTLLPASWTGEEELVGAFDVLCRAWQPARWLRLMRALLPHLSQERLRDILPAFLRVSLGHLPTDGARVNLLRQLAEFVSEETLPVLLEAIWTIEAPAGQREVLTALLTAPRAVHYWPRVLELVVARTRATGEIGPLTRVIQAAPVSLQQTALARLYPIVHDIFSTLARHPRREVLGDLVALVPALQALGNAESLVTAAWVVVEIGRWWP